MASRRIATRRERQESNASIPKFIQGVLRKVNECVRLASSDHIPVETLSYCITILETQERQINRVSESLISGQDAEELLTQVTSLLAEFRKGNCESETTSTTYQAQREKCGTPTGGAPKYSISRQQLQFLVHCGFKIPRVSQLLHVSKRTVIRRMKEYGISIVDTFSGISDSELDDLIKRTITKNRHIGPNAVKSRLLGLGHKIQRQRVRDSMLRIDPAGSATRRSVPTKRRTYTVAGPNSVWHLDGNHKLIRWKLIIHGGIDGFSRLIVYLQASSNNKKDTVLRAFVGATDTYNVPSRICVDHGGENNAVCDVMNLIRGGNRGSVIKCKSVHNQRIERAWVDVWNGATNLFYDIFQFLEERGSLDINNDEHIWAIHYVFLPRLSSELQTFQHQWNNHGLRTESHETPMQKFVGGALELRGTTLTAIQDLFPKEDPATGDPESMLERGWCMDEDDASNSAVEVPAVACPLTDEAYSQLKDTVNPMEQTTDLGMDLYLRTLDFIEAQHS